MTAAIGVLVWIAITLLVLTGKSNWYWNGAWWAITLGLPVVLICYFAIRHTAKTQDRIRKLQEEELRTGL